MVKNFDDDKEDDTTDLDDDDSGDEDPYFYRFVKPATLGGRAHIRDVETASCFCVIGR